MVTGVKIIPELDGPSHTGAGWDWGPLYGMEDLILCLDKQPWDDYCAQPPCGILNPINDKIYTVLSNIYKDMADLFQSDMFHMGGDEVNMRCWQETESITKWLVDKGWDKDPEAYVKLWSHYQNQSLAKLVIHKLHFKNFIISGSLFISNCLK
jgi:hexosaminidase